ncbi:hypothetical protein V500_09370 [Pseudogymnoascus sp. VKM F-4518 (FW-2643)]|nr:hypothetical protein V500_09370 [Pseudogymnoascus sp. VKM F-4518 (FW-2643)]
MTATMAASVDLRLRRGVTILDGPGVCDPPGGHTGNARRQHTQRGRTCTSIAAIMRMTFFRFLDVCDFVVKTTAINVTDLDTLDIWLLKPNELSSGSNYAWNFRDYILPSIRKLNVALRLPLAFYGALEEDEDMISVASHHTSAVSMRCAMWKRLWPAICQLPQLRSLHIWLDHDGRPSWSFVNERLALRRVIAALTASAQSRSEEGTMPHMDIMFNLPKLHPRFSRPDTHFQESPPPPFTIERRIRQRFHCEERAGGNFEATYKADFPVLHQLPEYIKENAKWLLQGDGMMSQEEDEMTLEDVEKFETMLWNEGTTDPYSLIVE